MPAMPAYAAVAASGTVEPRCAQAEPGEGGRQLGSGGDRPDRSVYDDHRRQQLHLYGDRLVHQVCLRETDQGMFDE